MEIILIGDNSDGEMIKLALSEHMHNVSVVIVPIDSKTDEFCIDLEHSSGLNYDLEVYKQDDEKLLEKEMQKNSWKEVSKRNSFYSKRRKNV